MPESPDINLTLAASPIIEVAPDGGVTIDVSMSAGGGSGDVVGPASATDNAIARFNGTTGKLIQNSGITIADGAAGVLSGTNSGDQNLFGTFAVSGQSNVVADSTNDTLTLVAGTNVTLTTDPTTDSITINATTSGGDVVGPASATDNALVRFDSTTGKLIQNGQITQSDTGDLASVNSIAMDTTPTGSLTTAGQMMWSADDETLDIQLNGFAMHTGQHVLYHVRNSTGSTIAKGVPVMFAGTTGNSGKLLIQPWNGTGPSTYFMGLTAESLTNGSEGFVIAFGKLNGIQTNGGNYGETWADGEIIYAGTTTGSLTKTQPAAPNPHVQVLAVVHAHASNGTVFINRTLGSNIKDDEGVTITSLSTGQILVANSAGTVFENKSVSGDATLANTGALTLATVNSNVGSFGSSTAVPVLTVNAKGLITAVSTSTVAPAIGNVTGLGTNVATSLANNMAASGTLAILGANTFAATQTITPAANSNALAVSGYSLTGSNAQSLVDLAGTWNTSGTPTAIKCNITNTASNASSLLMDLQAGGVSRFSVPASGFTTVRGSANTNSGLCITSRDAWAAGNSTWIAFGDTTGNSSIKVPFSSAASWNGYFGFEINGSVPGGKISFNTAAANSMALGSSSDVVLARQAAGSLQFGVDHATTPTAQTIKSHNVTTGTGASLTLAGGTGSVAGGSVALATSTTTGAPVARVTALASGDVTLCSTAAGYLHISGNTIAGGFGGSTSNRPILRMSSGAGSAIQAVVGGISSADYFGVISSSGTANVNCFGVFNSNTALTANFGAAPKDATGSYTGAGHTTAIIGGQASSVTTGGAGGALTLTGGAAAGSGNNNGGDVTITGGVATGTGTRGNVLITNLPTSSAGLPTGALWNDAGTLKIA